LELVPQPLLNPGWQAPIKKHIRQTFANIEQGVREPRSIGPMLRENLIGLFRSRGGGLYALGYVATFVLLEVLEIPEFIGDVAGLFTGSGTLPGSLLALIVDFFVDTIGNMILAFMWPALLINYFEWVGVAMVAIGFATYDRFLRPIVERFVPELKVEPLSADSSPDESEDKRIDTR